MKLVAMTAATLAIAGCGAFSEAPCVVDANVVGIALADPGVNRGPGRASLRVGQTVEVCMFGTDGCSYVDQRFEFRSDAPSVVAVTTNPIITSPGCRELLLNYTYPCCEIRVGSLTAVGAGSAQVQGVLSRGGSVEKTAGLIWSPPPPGIGGCQPVTGIDVTP